MKVLFNLDAEKVTQLRREHNLTLPALAKTAGVSYLTLLNSVGTRGQQVKEATAMKIASALGVGMNDIVCV